MTEMTPVQRRIVFDGQPLADLNPDLPVRSVVDLHARTRPALLNAQIQGPELQEGVAVYTVNTKVGVKG